MTERGSPSPPVRDSSKSDGVASNASSVKVPPPVIGVEPWGNEPPLAISGSAPASDLTSQKDNINARNGTADNDGKSQQQPCPSRTDPATAAAAATTAHTQPQPYGFFFGPAPRPDPVTGQLSASVLARINPLYNAEHDSVPHMVQRLRNPPDYLYNADRSRVTIDIIWAIGIIGREHFHSSCIAERLYLRENSIFRRDVVGHGLPRVVLDWFCNQPEKETLELPADEL